MKKKIKDLTLEECKLICKKYINPVRCEICPINKTLCEIYNFDIAPTVRGALFEIPINDLNQEIEVNEDVD